MQEDGEVANRLAAPSHWKMLSRVKTGRGGDFVLTERMLTMLIFPHHVKKCLLYSLEKDSSDMRLHGGSWQKTVILQSSWPHPLASRRQLAVALMKDPMIHILDTFHSIIHHAHLLPQRPACPMSHVQSQL